MKYGIMILIMTFVLGVSLSQNKGKNGHVPINAQIYHRMDTLTKAMNKTTSILDSIRMKIDTVKMMNKYLNSVQLSHNYRVYKYPAQRLKLVYKWQKGRPGHWELIKKIRY